MTLKRAPAQATGKKASPRSGKNWLLAVDPYVDFDLAPMRRLAIAMADDARANLIAGYVLAPASFNWTGEFSGPWMKKYKPAAEDKLLEIFGDDLAVNPTVIPCQRAGQRASVQCLTKFAAKARAEMIVISTHARHGLERWALGSFAESLILSSKVPVMIVNPAQKVPEKVRRILVPTDLTKESEAYVKANASLARRLGAAVTLFFKQPDPLDPMIQQGVYTLGGGWVTVQNFIEEDVGEKRRRMDKLELALRKLDVNVTSVIDTTSAGLIEGINAAVKSQNADMISVWTHSSPMSAAILGSVARGLIRTSEVPVLVSR